MTFLGQSEDVEAVEAEQLACSAYDLADFFNGTVMDEHSNRVPRPSIMTANYPEHFRPPAEPTYVGDVELCPYAAEPTDAQGRIQLNIFADAARSGPVQISLEQIRDWYKLAKALQRSENYLVRIVAIGKLFKQQHGKGQPNMPQPFTGWTADEVEAWLWDLAVQEERQAQQKASAAAPPVQMDLFA